MSDSGSTETQRRRNYGASNHWLSELARVIIDSYLDQTRSAAGGEPPVPSSPTAPQPPTGAEIEQMREAIQQLPAAERLVLQLHDVQNFSYREIARGLNLPRGTIHSRAARGRRKLRHILARYAPAPAVTDVETQNAGEGDDGWR